MNRLFAGLLAAGLLTSPALAENRVFIAMNNDDAFQNTLLDNARQQLKKSGLASDHFFSKGDEAAQIAAVKAAIEDKVSAVIIAAPSAAVATQVDAMAADAGIPLVFMNVMPPVDQFHSQTTIVSSNDLVAGRMQMRYIGKLIGNSGDIAILIGDPKHPAGIGRTNGVKEVLSGLPGIRVVAEAPAFWTRDEARKIVGDWLKAGKTFKAIAANNDEMAIGAAEAIEAAGLAKGSVVIGGVDATGAALDAMEGGHIAFTILQNAKAQGELSADNTVALLKGQPVQLYDWVPYELVTTNNMANYR